MPTRSRLALLLGVLACARPAGATVDVQAALTAVVGTTVQVRLTATNTGDETALSLTSEATADGDVRGGWPVARLAGGETTEWNLDLAVPADPGGFVVTGRVRWATPDGRWRSTVAATAGCGRDCGPSTVALSLPYGPIFLDRLGLTSLRLSNPGPEAIAAAVGLTAPDGVTIRPAEQETVVPAGGTIDLEFTVENTAGLTGGPYDAVARLTHRDGESRRVALLPTTLGFPEEPAEPAGDWGPPGLAAAALLGTLAVAARRFVRGRPPWRFGTTGSNR